MKFEAVKDAFLDSQRARNNAPATIDWYGYMLDSFTNYLKEKAISGDDLLKPETIEQYLLAEKERGKSEQTLLGRFRALRAFYKWMYERHPFEQNNPFQFLHEPRTADEPPASAEREQIGALLAVITGEDWISQRNRVLIRLLFDTGLRVGEVARLAPSDIDLAERFVRVMRKGSRVQFVPFSVNLVYDLAMWIDYQRPETGADLLWPGSKPDGSPTGKPLTVSGIQQIFRRLRAKAGIGEITPHTLRHGCAQDIIQNGGDLSTVQSLLGHQRIETTRIYLRYKDVKLRQLLDKLHRSSP